MNMKVMAALGLATVSASTCTEMIYTIHPDATCTATAVATMTAKEVPVGSCFQASFALAGWATVAAQKEYIRVDYCQAADTTNKVKGGVFYHTYSDAKCEVASTTSDSAVMGGSTDCLNINGFASSKWAIKLTGNPYGLGWGSGFTLFFCQTLLFGICAGA
jgi:hypothetical protein